MFEIIKNQNRLLILHFVVHLLNKCDIIIMWFDIFQIDDKSFYEKKPKNFSPFSLKILYIYENFAVNIKNKTKTRNLIYYLHEQ